MNIKELRTCRMCNETFKVKSGSKKRSCSRRCSNIYADRLAKSPEERKRLRIAYAAKKIKKDKLRDSN